jgi:hypothetical protein
LDVPPDVDGMRATTPTLDASLTASSPRTARSLVVQTVEGAAPSGSQAFLAKKTVDGRPCIPQRSPRASGALDRSVEVRIVDAQANPYARPALMRLQGRIDKTLDKMCRGGLPAPRATKPVVETGNGNRCSGCSATIDPIEQMYFIVIRGVGSFHFHDICYNAWATFKTDD